MAETSQLAGLETLLKEIDPSRLTEFNRQIASEVRLSGSAEELRAFLYIKQQLESFGLQTQLVFDEAYISLPGKAELLVGGRSFAAVTHAMAAHAEELKGGLKYVEEPSGEKLQLEGEAVIVHGLANWPVVQRLQHLGASAVIFINSGAYTHEMIVSSVWGNPQPEDDGYPLIPVLSVNAADGETIRTILSANGESNAEIKLRAEVKTEWIGIPTLTAEIKGTVEPNLFVLFSGHVDSWHYGAMDNGSANAVLLETARVLSLHAGALRRSVRFAFWSGHSHGRYAGSALYSDRHWEDLYENGIIHINIDSVGAKGADVLGAANVMAETKELAAKAVGLVSNEPFRGTPFGRSGDQSFWGQGLPSLFMGLSYQPDGWFGWWWHTTEDTLDKLDEAYLERDCKVYTTAVYYAVSSPLVPIDQRVAAGELASRIRHYAKLAEGHVDFTGITKRTEELQEAVSRLYDGLESKEQSDSFLYEANRSVLALSRLLVPVRYVRDSRFDHDPALSQPLVPALADAEQLATAVLGSDEYFRLRTRLVRNLNRISFELKHAIQLIQESEGKLDLA